jgi:NAD(P) transhydrogenase
MFAALGTKVTVVEQRCRLLEFCDSQVVEALQYHLRDLGVVLRFGETVTAVEKHSAGAIVNLASGKRVLAEAVLYSAGRQGATADLKLENAGLEADRRGRIPVNARYRTRARHIYAVGDVIGFPSLAASSMSRAGWPPSTPSAFAPARQASRCRSGSTPSPRSASSAAPRRS